MIDPLDTLLDDLARKLEQRRPLYDRDDIKLTASYSVEDRAVAALVAVAKAAVEFNEKGDYEDAGLALALTGSLDRLRDLAQRSVK